MKSGPFGQVSSIVTQNGEESTPSCTLVVVYNTQVDKNNFFFFAQSLFLSIDALELNACHFVALFIHSFWEHTMNIQRLSRKYCWAASSNSRITLPIIVPFFTAMFGFD